MKSKTKKTQQKKTPNTQKKTQTTQTQKPKNEFEEIELHSRIGERRKTLRI